MSRLFALILQAGVGFVEVSGEWESMCLESVQVFLASPWCDPGGGGYHGNRRLQQGAF